MGNMASFKAAGEFVIKAYKGGESEGSTRWLMVIIILSILSIRNKNGLGYVFY